MKLRIANIRFGVTALFVTACVGGMMLGGTFADQSVQDGNHLLGLNRFFLREAHSHGNFMAIFNILVGLLVNNLNLSEKAKTACSYSAMLAFMLPVGLLVTGIMGLGNAPPIGLIGILGAATALIILIIGAFKTK